MGATLKMKECDTMRILVVEDAAPCDRYCGYGECSLDTDPGFEADVLRQPMTPDEYIEARETTFALYDALTQLPPTQARRVYQHYLLGMSKAEIAAAEGVGRSRICCSIERGLAARKNILKKSL